MKLSLIVENKTYEENIAAEHGLSLLIETDEKTILFDSGASDALIKNAKAMDIDLNKVDFAMLSHGHFDHSGGMPAFSDINAHADIYIHESAFHEAYECDKDGNPKEDNVGIRWSDEEKEKLAPQIKYTHGPLFITDNIIISGSIPVDMRETGTERFLEKVDGDFRTDKMDHEQFLIVKDDGRLNLFTGCSHSGVKPIVDYTKQLFPDMEIKLLFGGFHLYSSSMDALLNQTSRICDMDVEYFLPVHCTGLKAIYNLKELLDDRCIVMNAGEKLFL